MTALILGLLLFFSTHSASIFAENNRAQYIAHYGLAKWAHGGPAAIPRVARRGGAEVPR